MQTFFRTRKYFLTVEHQVKNKLKRKTSYASKMHIFKL